LRVFIIAAIADTLQFQDMHRMLEAKEAALIDSARAAMLAKVTNLQSQ
jgi:hypothetical protein